MGNFQHTKAPKPITPVRGGPWRPPEPSQTPQDLPTGYPTNLKVRTLSVFVAAIEAFPRRIQVLDLCKKVLTDLAPGFCEEVRAGRLRSDLAPSQMDDLLQSLLVYNVSTVSERFRLGQELKRSKEWGEFVRSLLSLEAHLESEKSLPRVQIALEAHIEELNRRLSNWRDRSMPAYRGTIQRKKVLEHELARLKGLGQKPEDAPRGSSSPSLNVEDQAPLTLESPKVRPSYSPREVGRLLHCSERRIRQLVHSHRLRRTSLGGRIVNDEKLKAEYEARNEPVRYQ